MAGGWPGPMPPGLLNPPPSNDEDGREDHLGRYLGDEDLAQQIARDQGVPMDVARYMLQAPSYGEGQGMNNPLLPSQAWPYQYQGQSQEAQSQRGAPPRDYEIDKDLWRQRLSPPGAQNIADQPTPFGPPGNPAGESNPMSRMYEDFARRTGRPEWFGGQQWNGPMRMSPGTQGHPANEALLQQAMRLYGLA